MTISFNKYTNILYKSICIFKVELITRYPLIRFEQYLLELPFNNLMIEQFSIK